MKTLLSTLLILALAIAPAQAGTTISGLPSAGSVTTADLVEIVQGGTSKKATVSQILNGLTIVATTGTLWMGSGKTLTVSNTMLLTSTDGATLNIGIGGTLGTMAYAATTSYQPIDGDLTSLAAGTGTNTIYYRNGTNSWAEVTIGTGLTFTGGSLALGDLSGTYQPLNSKLTALAALSNAAGWLHNNGSGTLTWSVPSASDLVTGTLAKSIGGLGTDVSASTGIPKFASGTLSFVTAPTGVLVGTSDTQTLTNKTMDGGTNTFTSIPYTALTGTITAAKGGTGFGSYTDGQLLIGNTFTASLSKATLTAGSNITITNGNGTITIAAAGSSPGGSSGDVQYNNAGAFGGLTGLTTSSGVLKTITISPANDTTGLTLTGGSITGSGTTPFLSATGTFNTTGVVTAYKWYVTDTLSGTGSLLADWGVGSTSAFKIAALPSGNGTVTLGGFGSAIFMCGGTTNYFSCNFAFGDAWGFNGATKGIAVLGAAGKYFELKPTDADTLTLISPFGATPSTLKIAGDGTTESKFLVMTHDGTDGLMTSTSGKLILQSASTVQLASGVPLSVVSGSNLKAGTFTLSSGSATVSNTSVTANSVIHVTVKTVSGTRAGNPDIVPTASTGFTATGAGTDNSTYNYWIEENN